MAVLYIVSTPIGNMADISLRALQVLFSVPVIAAEDTRRTGNLVDFYTKRSDLLAAMFNGSELQMRSAKPRYISFHEFNENARIEEILKLMADGLDVALVSDGGTPLISDPGFKLVRQALKEKARVVSIPGASAWLTALTTSGMPPDRVLFVGFFPPRERRRRKELHQLKEAVSGLRKEPTIAFYESPHRLVATLRDIFEVAGNVELVLGKELTKLHEKVDKRSVSLWIAELEKFKNIKGEYVGLFRFGSSSDGVSTNGSELTRMSDEDVDDEE